MAARDADASLEYEVPDGWEPGQLVVSRGGITLRHEAAFDVGGPDGTAEVTVVRLPAMGSLSQNVNRWRAQVGLGPLDAEQVQQQLESIQIGEVPARQVRLFGESEAIVGAIATHGGQTWYFKLKGDKQRVEREEQRFRRFLESVRLP
jgi:hypothetical protein